MIGLFLLTGNFGNRIKIKLFAWMDNFQTFSKTNGMFQSSFFQRKFCELSWLSQLNSVVLNTKYTVLKNKISDFLFVGNSEQFIGRKKFCFVTAFAFGWKNFDWRTTNRSRKKRVNRGLISDKLI